MDVNGMSNLIIGAAIDVHKALGPGLLESAYEECLCYELEQRNVKFERQKKLPVEYKKVLLECGYRIDILVEDTIVVELKSVDCLTRLHDAQLLTYLRLGGWKLGMLMNFNVPLLRDGTRRKVMNFSD
jgi:GxxExxY protein